MDAIEARNEKAKGDTQVNIDRAVEEALGLDFASFEEVKGAFQE